MRVAIACLRPFQKLPHLLELLQQPVDFRYGTPRPLCDPQASRSREARRIGPLAGRHGQHDRLDVLQALVVRVDRPERDRKSTRLNSSHMSISYAVFCLKKKKKKKNTSYTKTKKKKKKQNQ